MLIALLLAAVFLAYANGANDNFKGVATLFGSQTSGYREALTWACWTTLAGSLASVWVAQGLLSTFSGKGLVPDATAASPHFLVSVGFGAAATVLAASYLGLPISTTHALTGALVGAGLVHGAGEVAFSHLGSTFFIPLLVSPLLAMALTVGVYLIFRMGRLGWELIRKAACAWVQRSSSPNYCRLRESSFSNPFLSFSPRSVPTKPASMSMWASSWEFRWPQH